jgi:thioredoxin 1
MEITLTNENFEKEVLQAAEPVLVDFWADWCGPCHMIAPSLKEIADEYKGRLRVGKLNVDEYPDTAQRYQVRGIPNLKIFKKGMVVDEIVGAQPKGEIAKTVDKYL